MLVGRHIAMLFRLFIFFFFEHPLNTIQFSGQRSITTKSGTGTVFEQAFLIHLRPSAVSGMGVA